MFLSSKIMHESPAMCFAKWEQNNSYVTIVDHNYNRIIILYNLKFNCPGSNKYCSEYEFSWNNQQQQMIMRDLILFRVYWFQFKIKGYAFSTYFIQYFTPVLLDSSVFVVKLHKLPKYKFQHMSSKIGT